MSRQRDRGEPMPERDERTHEEQVDEIVEMLLHGPLPKAERIKLMKELVRKGNGMPEEVLADALKRLMERILEHP